MARYTGPRTKVSRRARQLLDDNKAKYFDRRPYPPGDHGRGRIRESQYQIQLRELAYRLYQTCDRKKWAEEARAYNGLVVAWPELAKLAAQNKPGEPSQRSAEHRGRAR